MLCLVMMVIKYLLMGLGFGLVVKVLLVSEGKNGMVMMVLLVFCKNICWFIVFFMVVFLVVLFWVVWLVF